MVQVVCRTLVTRARPFLEKFQPALPTPDVQVLVAVPSKTGLPHLIGEKALTFPPAELTEEEQEGRRHLGVLAEDYHVEHAQAEVVLPQDLWWACMSRSLLSILGLSTGLFWHDYQIACTPLERLVLKQALPRS